MGAMPLSILLVEDAEADKTAFCRLLGEIDNFSVSVDWAATAAQARERLDGRVFDIVVMDIGLPDGRGIDSLKDFERHIKKQPFIILTGEDDDSLLIEVSSIGIYDYLVKGELTPSLLRRSIRYAISRFLFEAEQQELNNRVHRSQRLETLGKITGSLSHDINNKLAVVRANIDLLSKGGNLGDGDRARLDSMTRTLDKTAELTKKLLAYGRRQELDMKRVDICSVLSEGLGLLKNAIKPNVAIDYECPPDRIFVRADPIQMDQVVMNLVINAQEAIGDDDGSVRIKVEKKEYSKRTYGVALKMGRFVSITVTDTGCGVEESIRERIFEPFFTTKEDKGTGLGLSVVDGIVNQHGGFVEVRGRPGGGTAFEVFLPELAGRGAARPR